LIGDFALSLPKVVVETSGKSSWGKVTWHNLQRSVSLHGSLSLREAEDKQVNAFVEFVGEKNDAREVLEAALLAPNYRWHHNFSLVTLVGAAPVNTLEAPKRLRRECLRRRWKSVAQVEHGPFVIPLAFMCKDPWAVIEDTGSYEVHVQCGLLAQHGWRVLCVPPSWRDDLSWMDHVES